MATMGSVQLAGYAGNAPSTTVLVTAASAAPPARSTSTLVRASGLSRRCSPPSGRVCSRPLPSSSSSSSARSTAAGRSPGRAAQALSTRSIMGVGRSGRKSRSDGSRPAATLESVSAGVCPRSGCPPASSSYSTMPAEYTSLGGPTRRPDACSGDMYATVPITSPSCVSVSASMRRAMPKSMTLTCPSLASITFCGLTSRWMMPWLCANARALSSSAPTAATSPSLRRPCSLSSDSPSTSSHTSTSREPSPNQS